MTEHIFEAYWEGPYSSAEEINKAIRPENSNKYVLYKIYGSHPLYGRNVLLYIGRTQRGADNRLKEHSYWSEADQYGEAKIYIASLGKFESWKKSVDIPIFDIPDNDVLSKIEALLIYAHQPAYNSMNKNTARNSYDIRLFNTGEFGALFPEISSLYHNIKLTCVH